MRTLPPGRYVEVSQRFVRMGDVVMLPLEGDHVVLHKRVHDSARFQLTLEEVKTGKQRKTYVGKDEKIWRFKVQGGLRQRWEMSQGDVVVYPADRTVAIRHRNGWFASARKRSLLPDAWILADVIAGQAKLVRSSDLRHAVRMQRPYLPGSVAAVSDLMTPEPTAWVCTDWDLWRSTTWVEASDAMIEMGLKRGSYALLYVPKPEGTT